jgi:hypothetical protein
VFAYPPVANWEQQVQKNVMQKEGRTWQKNEKKQL